MRSFSYSSLALLASSLLVKEAFASPLGKRAIVTDTVVVTEQIIVTQFPDGGYRTGKGKPIGTQTIAGVVVVTTEAPVAAPTPKPEPTPKPVTTQPAAVFKEEPKSTTAAALVPIKAIDVAPAAPIVSTTAPAPVITAAPAPVSTTLVKVPAPVKSTTTKKAPAPVASSPPSSGTSGGKRGIAYNDASLCNAFVGDSSVTWAYNWGSSTSDIPSQFEFVPTLWGLGEHANGWEQKANEAISAGSKHLFAFNEPDHWEQANLDVGTAAQGYKDHMQPFAGKARLGAPSVTNGGAPMGLTYLSNFMEACDGCTIDFVNIHWYNGGDANAFKEYIGKVRAVAGGRKIWITEFQAPGSPSEQLAWLAEVLPFLDSQDDVEKYSYFMASEGNLISGGGLSAIGKAFVS